jgi:hypothetical protein
MIPVLGVLLFLVSGEFLFACSNSSGKREDSEIEVDMI